MIKTCFWVLAGFGEGRFMGYAGVVFNWFKEGFVKAGLWVMLDFVKAGLWVMQGFVMAGL